MALTITTAARNAAADALGALVNGGAGPGLIRIYTGSSPGPGSAATGTLLAEFTLSDPAFGAASVGVITLDVTPALTDDGIATGTAGYFRILDSTPTAIADGTVTATGGGGDMQLNTVSIVTGVAVELTAGTITMPAS